MSNPTYPPTVKVDRLADIILQHLAAMPFDANGTFEKIVVQEAALKGPKSVMTGDKSFLELQRNGFLDATGFLTERGEALFQRQTGFSTRELYLATVHASRTGLDSVRTEIGDFAVCHDLVRCDGQPGSALALFVDTHLQNEDAFAQREYSFKGDSLQAVEKLVQRVGKQPQDAVLQAAFRRRGAVPTDYARDLWNRAKQAKVDVSDLISVTVKRPGAAAGLQRDHGTTHGATGVENGRNLHR